MTNSVSSYPVHSAEKMPEDAEPSSPDSQARQELGQDDLVLGHPIHGAVESTLPLTLSACRRGVGLSNARERLSIFTKGGHMDGKHWRQGVLASTVVTNSSTSGPTGGSPADGTICCLEFCSKVEWMERSRGRDETLCGDVRIRTAEYHDKDGHFIGPGAAGFSSAQWTQVGTAYLWIGSPAAPGPVVPPSCGLRPGFFIMFLYR